MSMHYNRLQLNIYFLVILSIGCFTTSCRKLIEIPADPSNQLSNERVFADSANIIAAVSAVYSNYGASLNVPEFGSGVMTVFTGLTSDELVPGSDMYVAPSFFNNNILQDNQTVASIWSNAYKNIFQINICLKGIEGTKAISDGLKSLLIAELKVSRAFYYYHMVNLWGGVPIITSVDYAATRNVPRASITEVFNFILTDLNDAARILTPDYPSEGHTRPNLHVVQALLAKVYLYLGQYEDAVNAASEVIASPDYNLEDHLDDVFLGGSTEAIWQLPANGSYQQTPEAATFIPYTSNYLPNYTLSPQLLAAFEADDQRMVHWTGVSEVDEGGTIFTYYYPYKYKNTSEAQTPREDYMILRLADIYLVRAEALARLDRISASLEDLNKVRYRAGLGDVETNSGEIALDAILHERQVEMFCEWGNRWIDLKRTGKIDEVLGAVKPGWKANAALFPIPVAELQANPFLEPNP
ncbi:RagB/SusD family nutrient uptake outer membrane protein [Chitinophaga sp. XS-30]|uniref:RagB/SusD family nutrient uptake outer membrane protein n=1 Tax=Chitinophaga sp. XS-30 TaxID=2604421 RepID=UPI0011DC874D|nr:RagB/SusD family nutrient uptake outer membrane protein [Chitinophaga sp. XS-30]QEH39562.1 RagB/SusD family nutrient uptake outer membrane protein [Chitinophaga sp. XS-30]